MNVVTAAEMVTRVMPARNFTVAHRRKALWIVIHTMETPEGVDTAEQVARWFASPGAPDASAHYCIDQDSIVQCVDPIHVAWHAPGANRWGIGVEHAGRASQTAEQWRDQASSKILALSARLVGQLCFEWDIAVRRIGPAELLAGESGICGHYDVTKAFKKSTHTDPGPNFPWDEYLAAAEAA